MSDRDFRTWLKIRLTKIHNDAKAPDSLKEKIRQGIQEVDQVRDGS